LARQILDPLRGTPDIWVEHFTHPVTGFGPRIDVWPKQRGASASADSDAEIDM
jgi:hypothetical protein